MTRILLVEDHEEIWDFLSRRLKRRGYDVVIATEDSSIGMGGPAMIQGGGLGVFAPGEVGPIQVQDANGVVDLRVPDDAAAVVAAQRYLSYFSRTVPAPLLRGIATTWTCGSAACAWCNTSRVASVEASSKASTS